MKNQLQKTDSVLLGVCCIFVLLCIGSLVQSMFLYSIPIWALICNGYLWKHADVLTNQSIGSRKIDTYRSLLILSCFLVVMFLFLSIANYFLPNHQDLFQDMRYMLLVFYLLLFSNQAPKIPFNRTLGLRISWTLDDEATWKYAHRMIGYCGIPCALGMLVVYVAGYQQIGFVFLLASILLPSLLSYRFYRKQGWVLTETTAAMKSIWIIPILHVLVDLMVYSYLPYDLPMQFANNGTVNYTWPKPYGLAVMIGVEVLLILYYRQGSAKRLWSIVGLLFLVFLGVTVYILLRYAG